MSSEILIIDDEEHVLSVTKAMINTRFPTVICTTFNEVGPKLFSYVEENKVDLIISDVQLPGVSDIGELAQRLYKRTSAVFLFISGRGYDYDHFDKLLGSSCIYDFMAKPFSIENLESKVKTLLNISKSYSKVKTQLDSVTKTFSAVTKYSSDSTLILDKNGYVKYSSPSIKKFTICDYSVECVGSQFVDLCDDDLSKQRFKTVFEKVLASNTNESFLVTNINIKSDGGDHITFDCRLTNMIDINGVEGIVVNTRETTMEGKLRNSIWDIFNYLNFILVYLDKDMNIVLANYYLAKTLGYKSEKELIGLNWGQFLLSDEKELVTHVHQENLNEGNNQFREFLNKLRNKNGDDIEVRWFNCTVTNGTVGTFSIGIPGDEVRSVESMRAYWRDIIEKDKTSIKAMKSLFKAKENGANSC